MGRDFEVARLFRRRKQEADVEGDVSDLDDVSGEDGDAGPDEAEPAGRDAGPGPDTDAHLAGGVRPIGSPPAVLIRPQGPWDAADAPDSDTQRVDLGGMRVPVPAETEVRVDVGAEGEILAATLIQDGGSMQLSVFAAPRTEGIWAEIADEIAGTVVDGRGTAERVQGPYGTEVHARVPTAVPGQGVVPVPARFLGVDGPRWFLRALLTGQAAVDDVAAAPLLSALKEVVVVRGSDPMAVRDPLPLRLPRDIVPADPAASPDADPDDTGAEEPAAKPDLSLLERGPEITETR